jgi:NADP-dependent 3-hydroxy acid dehydrogenase YdfG
MQSELLAKQCVVVVGGSAGIGLAIASAAAHAGASVVIAARDASRLRSALTKIGSARTYEVDAADEQASHGEARVKGRVQSRMSRTPAGVSVSKV